MRLQITTDLQSLRERLDRLRRDLPDRRHQLVRQLAQAILDDTIRDNPVDTGRSRAAWVAPLEQLGGQPPAGWPGPHPDPTAMKQGTNQSALEQQQTDTSTTITATNQVDYISYLEYGTSRQAPRAMLRKAIQSAARALQQQPTHLLDTAPT